MQCDSHPPPAAGGASPTEGSHTARGSWCQINFAEAYTMMMHLKAIRIFVES
jgi:hypothetical protein